VRSSIGIIPGLRVVPVGDGLLLGIGDFITQILFIPALEFAAVAAGIVMDLEEDHGDGGGTVTAGGSGHNTALSCE
jgi:hypothetical protein